MPENDLRRDLRARSVELIGQGPDATGDLTPDLPSPPSKSVH